MPVKGDVLLRLGLDAGEVRKGLRAIQGDVKGFASSVGSMKNMLGGAFAALGVGVAVKGLADLVLGGANAADEMGKLAQSVGVPVEELSAFAHAAGLSGLSIEETGAALAKLSKTMSDAASGTGAQAEAFAALGISVKDTMTGGLKAADAVLGEIADQFAGMRDGAGKTALAIELFGRSGAKLVPLLNAGAGGIAKLKDEAAALGLVLTEDTAKAAEEFNDNLERLHAVSRGYGNLVSQELVGPLSTLAVSFTESATGADRLRESAHGTAESLKGVAKAVVAAASAARLFNALSLVTPRWSGGGMEGRVKDAKAAVNDMRQIFAGIDGETFDPDAGKRAEALDALTKKTIELTIAQRKLGDMMAEAAKSAEGWSDVREWFGEPWADVHRRLSKTVADITAEIEGLRKTAAQPIVWKAMFDENMVSLPQPEDFVSTDLRPIKRDAPIIIGKVKGADEAKRDLASLKDAVLDYQKKIATFGKGDFAQLEWELKFGKLADSAKNLGAEGARLLPVIRELGAQLSAMEGAEKATKATADLNDELTKMRAALSEKAGATEFDRMVDRLSSGDLAGQMAEVAAESGEAAAAMEGQFLDIAKAADETTQFWIEFNTEVERAAAINEEVARIIDATRTPFERYAVEVAYLGQLHQSGALDAETYARAMTQSLAALAAPVENAIAPTISTAVHGFADMAQGARSFGEVYEAVWGSIMNTALNAMSEMLARWIAMKITMMALDVGTSGASSALGMTGAQIPVLTRGIGGPVTSGMPYIVGERGPELFTPNVSGQIIPNGEFGGGGNSTTVALNVNTLDAASFDDYLARNEGVLAKRIQRMTYKGRV